MSSNTSYSVHLAQIPYKHTALSTITTEIRLLELQPDIFFDGPLVANMLHVPLIMEVEQPPPPPPSAVKRLLTTSKTKAIPVSPPIKLQTPYYEAVSYVWGNEPVGTDMHISPNSSLRIRRNLEKALKRLRFRDRPRRLWVDAICVDQENVSERNSQVQLMKQIYNTAGKVLVYIGEEEQDSDLGMDVIADVDGDVRNHQGRPESAVSDLLSRSWFSRLWVIQEVARSRSAVVICGTRAVSWDCFARWPFRVRGGDSSYALPGILNYSSGFTPTSGGDSLLQLLYDNRNAIASDPRDKVFGILGLMEDNSPYLSLIRYDLSCEEAYTQAASNLWTESCSLRLLSAAGFQNRRSASKREVLPSWVPDWRFPWPGTSLALGKTFVEPFNAGGRLSFFVKPIGNKLTVWGTKLGSPIRISQSIHPTSNEVELLRQWMELAKIQEDGFEVLMRTLSASPVPAVQDFNSREEADSSCFWHLLKGDSEYWFGRPLSKRVRSMVLYRCLFVGEHGLLGLGPETMQPGDVVVVLLGGPTPYILRPTDSTGSRYWLVGECYVYDHMNGEAFHYIRKTVEQQGGVLPPTSTGPSYTTLQTFDIV